MSKVKYIYGLINNKDGIFYIGATINIEQRIKYHPYKKLFTFYKIFEIVDYENWEEREILDKIRS